MRTLADETRLPGQYAAISDEHRAGFRRIEEGIYKLREELRDLIALMSASSPSVTTETTQQ